MAQALKDHEEQLAEARRSHEEEIRRCKGLSRMSLTSDEFHAGQWL